MALPASSPRPEPAPRLERSDLVLLHGATWADLERLLEIRGEGRTPRFHYLDGCIEIMSPSRHHEGIKSTIGRLVECWCLENDVDFSPVGSWTLKDESRQAGAEPDECCVLGLEGPVEGGRPDLAIEVIWSHGRLNKLEIYRRLGVREVWIYKAGLLTPHGLVDDAYRELTRSRLLPDLELAKLLSFLDVRPTSAAIRAYREALRGS